MTADSQPNKIETYYVVPLVSGAEGIQRCMYFTENWGLASFPMYSNTDGFNKNLLRIVKPSYEHLPEQLRSANVAFDETASLFAAVVATIDEDLGLPTLFNASAKQSVVIPVADRSIRGVVLVFAAKDSKGHTILRPTTDPQIKNGSDGQT